jgi:hypothetical protein
MIHKLQNQFVLVSFCNLPSSGRYPVICLEIPFDGKKPTIYAAGEFSEIGKTIKSATGLASSAGRAFILFLSENVFHVAALRLKDFSLDYCQALPEIRDGHSILVSGDFFYAVSTGTDEILKYGLDENGLHSPEVAWRASDSGKDTHHINSIAEIDGEIFISAFGEKTGNLWSSATNGYIQNITRDICIKDGIYHPHSLSPRKGVLHYCDSSKKSFCSLEKPVFELDGYARGIGWLSDETVCVATSIGRKISKSTGLIANPADPGATAGKSKLSVRDIKNQHILAEIDLSRFGPEIYDILPLEGAVDVSKLKRLD